MGIGLEAKLNVHVAICNVGATVDLVAVDYVLYFDG
jgi:hypothetical protein